MKKYIILILSVTALTFIAGCTSTSVIDVDGTSDGITVINSKDSSVDVKILDTRTRIVGGILQVNMQLESNASSIRNLEYKFSWFDSLGMVIDSSSTAWEPFCLYGRETKTISGLAPNSSARSYKVKIREADNS
jgi:uncharacterized protein YcfL